MYINKRNKLIYIYHLRISSNFFKHLIQEKSSLVPSVLTAKKHLVS